MKDSEIIALYWRRDERAIAQTSFHYGDYCYTIAYNVLSDQQDSEECVNDTWLRAWNAIPPQRPDLLKSFLGRICRNLSLDRWRKNRASKRGGGELALILEELGECVGTDSPQAHLELEGLKAVLDRFLDGLPTDSRRYFLRRYWYADPIRAVAQRYRVSEGTVKSSLHRTRSKLKTILEQEGYL